jgi:hypothetical protein
MVQSFFTEMNIIRINMIRVFVTLCLSLTISIVYGAEVLEGSLSCIKGEKYITVKLDCSNLVYKKDRPFQDFLDKAQRIDDWEHESLKYFCRKFNEQTFKAHLSAVLETSKNSGTFEIVIAPFNINGSGSIKGEVYVFNKETREKVATISFKGEGDDNDEITLRDPMKEAGEELGKLFYKSIKK